MRVRSSPLHLLVLGVLAMALAGLLAPAPAPAQTRQAEQAAARKKLDDVRAKVNALDKQQTQTAAQRDTLNAELARQAQALGAAVRALRATDEAIRVGEQQLAALEARRDTLARHLDAQRAAIADLLRATYALGRGSDLQLLLGDEDVARIARALEYSRYFQEDRTTRVRQLLADLTTLQQTRATIDAKQQALAATRAGRQQQVDTLDAERAAQRKLAAQADAQYKTQAEQLAALRRDAQALDALVANLQRAIDQAARAAGSAAGGSTPARGPDDMAAANIRGNLPWPATGSVHRYGNGVLIKAAGGSEVHAVARGRVVYAGFLRGYGLLLIINHGNGWLSMYGNNEALLRGVGDEVAARSVIATASAPTGLNTGAYFELRKDGKPVDPRRWLAAQPQEPGR